MRIGDPFGLLLDHRVGTASGSQLAGEDRDQLARARDSGRTGIADAGPKLTGGRQERPRRQLHRPPPRRRTGRRM